MKLYHLSSITNTQSILNNGLKPSFIKLENHWNTFKGDGLRKRKCVYMWNQEESKHTTDKLIRDMIYCKLFIHPRNDMVDRREERNKRWEKKGKIDKWDDDKYKIDFTKLGRKLYGNTDTYHLYEIDINASDSLLIDCNYQHAQGGKDLSEFDSCVYMHEEYHHDSKALYIGKGVISPEKIKIISKVKSILYKNGKIGLRYL